MIITHEICIDHLPASSFEFTNQLCAAISTALGCKMIAADKSDTVNGRILSIDFCDTRELGKDVLEFPGGRLEVASADNIGKWLALHGHSLVKIVGSRAFGNTIITLQITEADEKATDQRLTTLSRPALMPTEQQLRDVIDNFAAAMSP